MFNMDALNAAAVESVIRDFGNTITINGIAGFKAIVDTNPEQITRKVPAAILDSLEGKVAIFYVDSSAPKDIRTIEHDGEVYNAQPSGSFKAGDTLYYREVIASTGAVR